MADETIETSTEPGAVVPLPGPTDADAPVGKEFAQQERRKRIAALKQELVDGDLLTAAEVAEILDVHPRTVGEYIRDGKLRAFQFGGSWRISENALRAFVRDLPRRCSFCGKEELQVHRLIAGPNGAYICAGCVAQCNEILAKETEEPARGMAGQ
ncbi:MAG: ClpX C4-type zinc finger protein [Dehalococcoidia bacterium]